MPATKPKPPAHLGEDGVRLWEDVTDAFALEPWQTPALRCAAEALDRAGQARTILEAEGLVVTDRYGQTKPHPATQIARDSSASFLRAMRELNLEPAPDDRRPPALKYGG
jgi:P27 family predicted phage terminase small subunit